MNIADQAERAAIAVLEIIALVDDADEAHRAIVNRLHGELAAAKREGRREAIARQGTASKLVEDGLSQRQAAKALGVSQSTVRDDVSRNHSQSEEKPLTKAERRAEREQELAAKQTATEESPPVRFGARRRRRRRRRLG
jgi:DNA-binding CsgD family transcriptional regulator